MSHIKRISMPKSWQMKRKEKKFVTSPLPGHMFERGMPLNVIIRDMLKLATNNKEVKNILHNKEILVDGERVKENRFIVGLMDTISIPEIEKFYRVLLNKKGNVDIQEIKKEEAVIKICKIKNKHKNKKDVIQLNLDDGRNILVKEDKYKTNDSLLISLPKQEIKDYIELKKKNTIFLIDGKYIGEIGVVEDIKGKVITFKSKNKKFETLKKYCLVVGRDKPILTIQ